MPPKYSFISRPGSPRKSPNEYSLVTRVAEISARLDSDRCRCSAAAAAGILGALIAVIASGHAGGKVSLFHPHTATGHAPSSPAPAPPSPASDMGDMPGV